ncbi:hypothetical protein [Halosaccharopolyspora lacisalsi]|uniref:hypothetical protein n=1 Tax=Halosaccharopolyspora lacisalsi TaxID=1000566 RepID=UPI0015FC1030|nr:hypothetical protein [Halosaccharopolyspora lacisalsi]
MSGEVDDRFLMREFGGRQDLSGAVDRWEPTARRFFKELSEPVESCRRDRQRSHRACSARSVRSRASIARISRFHAIQK